MKLKPFVKPVVTEHVIDHLINWNNRFWDGLSQRALDSALAKTPPIPELPPDNAVVVMMKEKRQIEATLKDLDELIKRNERLVARVRSNMRESIFDTGKTFMKRLLNLLKQNKGELVVAKLKSMPNAPKDLVDTVEKLNSHTEKLHSAINSYKNK
jgi:hypothetical protein